MTAKKRVNGNGKKAQGRDAVPKERLERKPSDKEPARLSCGKKNRGQTWVCPPIIRRVADAEIASFDGPKTDAADRQVAIAIYRPE